MNDKAPFGVSRKIMHDCGGGESNLKLHRQPAFRVQLNRISTRLAIVQRSQLDHKTDESGCEMRLTNESYIDGFSRLLPSIRHCISFY